MEDYTFKDGKGRTWNLSLNLGIARRIDKSDFSVYFQGKWSFIKPEKTVFSAMVSDNSFMFAVIWAIVIDQAKAYYLEGTFLPNPTDFNLSPEDRKRQVDTAFSPAIKPPDSDLSNYEHAEMEFAANIDGAAVEAGRAAFWRSLSSFFQDQKTVLEVLMRQYKNLRSNIDESMAKLEPEIQESLKKSLDKDMVRVRQKLSELTQEEPLGVT